MSTGTGQDAILAFFGGGKDATGRTFDEIVGWSDGRLEEVHDYVQWLFPTTKPSAFNRGAPTLDPGTILAFHKDAALRGKLLQAFVRMLRFYGFHFVERDGIPEVAASKALLDERREEWVTPGNHNLLRITRILDSLSTLGLEDHARAFLHALENLGEKDRQVIGKRTYDFWLAAVHGK